MEKRNYFTHIIPDIGDLLAPLEKAFRDKLLPTITGRAAISDDERELLALPVRLGGLGVPRADERAQRQFQASLGITGPLVSAILGCSDDNLMAVRSFQSEARAASRKEARAKIEEEANVLRGRLPRKMKKAKELTSEKGASAWLTTLPLAEEGFNLHKQAFRDALCLRYGWDPVRLPSTCVCGSAFTVEHSLSCPHGAFPSIRHDIVRDLTANLLTEVCHGVEIEPHLQPLTGEQPSGRSAIKGDNARQDIKAMGCWGNSRQQTFFDVRIFNPFAPSNSSDSLLSTYKKHEREKRREYERRIREIEHGTSTPLFWPLPGGGDHQHQ